MRSDNTVKTEPWAVKDEYNMREVVKILKDHLELRIGRNKLFELLRSEGVLDSNNAPLPGYEEHFVCPCGPSPYSGMDCQWTRVTPKGVKFIMRMMKKVRSKREK